MKNATKLMACGLLVATWVPACHAPVETDTGSATHAADGVSTRLATVSQVPQILSADTLQRYKAALPKVGFDKLQQIFDDPDTFWYDHQSMPGSYQDTVSDTSGCRRNDSGAALINIIPGGRQMFSADGSTFAFPFGHTAGTDNSTNKHVVDFMWLPQVDGKRLPVVYKIVRGRRSGFPMVQWRWMFPKGTVFGEMIFIKDSSGQLYPVELRTRERFLTGWATNAFRPFPTAASLAAAIREARPNWQDSENLRRFMAHLEDKSTLAAKRVGSRVYPGVFEHEGALDVLPDMGDPQLVKDLLTSTRFVSTYGATWKDSGALKTFAASTKSTFSIVPNNYEAGLIQVNDESCHRCHKDAQRSIEDFNSQAVLYGDIWGSDQIFSFHVFDPRTCRGSADDNRTMRPVFQSSGLVQRYDTNAHPAEYYKELP